MRQSGNPNQLLILEGEGRKKQQVLFNADFVLQKTCPCG